MTKRCKVCRRKPKLERRVNNEGLVFCTDDCYDDYDDSPNDMDHPYIDDYDAIRFEYITWMKEYEDDLYKYWLYGSPRKQDLLEDIEEFTDQFWDYYILEGNDGVFSAEIYDYMMGFERLQEIIKKWEPDTKELTRRRKKLNRSII